MKTFVVAGSYHQANEWIKQKIESLKQNSPNLVYVAKSQFVYVSCASDLRGYQDPHGVFIGTWRDRVDIREIVEALMIQSTIPHPKLREIWGEVSHKVKPTPKLRKITGGWVNEELAIQEAANQLSKAIDDEVMHQIMRKINGGNISTP